ncbi:DUF3073 domain-containing protein [Subtercola boreus]|uniref:DUF3073 domain-containing protein n=1 Tax=Subtercola boreus TaxID=120213 RepID=A0A3E0W604_9MICO|nr:DUF3073 domain-containing protein [Subtercola boreus]RFA17952.1 hypothetical protein B7R24_14910 [Subtercola boreus]RFA18334.1 hypothetical protein B7R23_14945 [Subtercola boreus]RFA24864.1 hypothetical protein B7R25_14940 [Subtercola boreus]
MGRGRQKAKHTKVARELKYFSPDTNYSALERELGTHSEPDFAALAAKYDTDPEADLDDPDLEDDDEEDDDLASSWGAPDEKRLA